MTTEDLPLNNIAYFAGWGGNGWSRLITHAVRDGIGTDLSGKRVLEIGSHHGKMSCLFALLGAAVDGVDVAEYMISIAQAEAAKWNVSRKTKFVAYDGNLDIYENETFDIVFTKSVLVLIPDLPTILRSISAKLKAGGRIVFIENAKGSPLVHTFRRLRHRSWNYQNLNYFSSDHLEIIAETFHLTEVKKQFWPPVYLIIGQKK